MDLVDLVDLVDFILPSIISHFHQSACIIGRAGNWLPAYTIAPRISKRTIKNK